jgi:ADP-ribose pyrophosphatase YjhB (NUDIX family)
LIAQTLVVKPGEEKLLLGLHKTGAFKDCYTGFLDYTNKNEPMLDAARRITLKQCGLEAINLELRAILTFTADDFGIADEYEFYANAWKGTPKETETIRPMWFGFDDIPYEKMPADDKFWYPTFLEGKLQKGHFHFASGMEDLLDHELYEVPVLDLRNKV